MNDTIEITLPTLEQLRVYVAGRKEQTAVCGDESKCIIKEWLAANNTGIFGITVWPGHGADRDGAEVFFYAWGEARERRIDLPADLAEFIDAFDRLGVIHAGTQCGFIPSKTLVLGLLDTLIAEEVK